MKKQINPTIKAHLIRGAFYLLLLVAVCAIPFALAQRNKLSSTKAQATKAPPTKAQIAAASGKVFQSGAPGALAGRAAPSKPGVGRNALPYDVRGVPDLPRISELPQKTSGVRAAHVIPIPRAPKAPQVVLYDQYDNASATATLSATFTDFPTFSADLADDFVVPGGQTWNVESIDADGVYFNGVGPATDWNVFIYADSGGLPGTQLFSTLNQPVSVSGTTFTVNLTPAAVLSAGTYWIEIQANMTFATQGEWGWTDRTVQSNNGAAWQNPGGGFAICPTWTNKLTCVPTAGGPDQVYRINGTTGGGGTPTPTPTATGTPGNCVVTGSIDTNDPTQTDRLFRSGIPQTCPSSNTCATFGDGLPRHYDSYTFTNTTGAHQCVHIDTNTACTGTNFIFTGAYLGSFDPANICTNWIGDAGFSPNPDQAFDVDLDDGQTVVVVVSEVTPDAGCSSYTVTVSGICGGGITPTPTPTASPSCTPIVINGSIDIGNPTQTDKLLHSGIPQTCPATTTCAIFGDPNTFRYDAHTFTNTTGAHQCVTIDTNTICNADHDIFTAAYLGSFDPANICTNWIGDSGLSPNPDQAFQVDVDNGQTLVVVVSEVHHAGCVGYALTITGLCSGTPTPTPTCTAGGGTPGPWISANSYPTTIVRYGFAQTATDFYVFGGVDNGSTTNAVNKYNLASGTWTSLAPMPFGDEAPTCALDESGGIVYCADGFGTNQFAAYNIASNSWTSLASDPFVPDHYGSASGFFNGQVFVAGGTSSFSNQVDVYNVGTNTWSIGTPAPVGPFLLAGYHQIGQFLYVVGGFDPSALNYATTLRLDMSTGTWDVGPVFTPQLADFGLAYDPGTNKLYSLGGDLPNDGNFFNSTNQVNELDVSAWPGGTWTSSPPLLPAPNRQANQAGFFGNGDIWSVGGLDGATFIFEGEVWHRTNGGCGGASPTPTATFTPTPTVTATATFTPTATATATATFTPTATATFTPTATATATTTATPTATPTHPPRPTPTPEPRPTPAMRPSYCYLNTADCSGLPNIINVTCFDCIANGGLSWKDEGGCHTTCPGPVRPNP